MAIQIQQVPAHANTCVQCDAAWLTVEHITWNPAWRRLVQLGTDSADAASAWHAMANTFAEADDAAIKPG
jgi:hypothetical protein